MKSVNRRGFLKKSAVTAAGLMVSAPIVKKGFAKNSPNETINVAVVGIRDRGGIYGGGGHYGNFCKIPNVRVAAVCDVDERLFPKAVSEVEELGGNKPKTVVDFRELIQDKDIDAVSIATPDHWHALMTIWACQAGKDVYVEKPVSYCLAEGRKMVQAARKYNRVVQAGTQRRSSGNIQAGVKFLQEGKLGDIYMSRATVLRFRGNIGYTQDSPIPNGVHWDLFLGPAPYRPFNQSRFSYNWHWYWDTSTTEFGNNGTHQIDVMRWAMNKRVHPVKIQCMGGFFAQDSDQEVPNIEVAAFQYEDGSIMECEVRSLFTNSETGPKFYGSEGWAQMGGRGLETFFGRKNEPGPIVTAEGLIKPEEKPEPRAPRAPRGAREVRIEPHYVNFIDCVRSRRWQDLNADILEGHMSTSLMHLGNVAYRTGRTLTLNPFSEKFINDDDANTYLTREYRHPYAVPDIV